MYFDPGTGSLIIQMVIAFAAMAGGALVAFRKKIAWFFKKGKTQSEDANPSDAEDELTNSGTSEETTAVASSSENDQHE